MIKRTSIPALLLLTITTAADATYLETTFTEYYTISPRAPQDILRELNWRSPIRENGMTFHGHTDWNISWNYKLQPVPGGCAITNIQTRVDIKYTLPKLDERITDSNITTRFADFNTALTRHEHNHGANGLKAAAEIDQALHALQTPEQDRQRNCRQLDRYANQTGHRIVQKYARLDSDYDRNTQNGRLEGAFIQ